MKRRRLSITEIRENLAAVVRSVEKGEVVAVTRRGQSVAVLVSARGYEALTGGPRDLWDAIRAFRESTDLRALRLDDVYRRIRDRSPGRRVGA